MPPIKSKLWSYFNKTDKKNIASCKSCQKVVKTSGNTSNLAAHLKTHNINFTVNDVICVDDDNSVKMHQQSLKRMFDDTRRSPTPSTSQIQALSTPKTPTPSTYISSKWSTGDIKCLLSLYKLHIKDFDLKSKIKVWEDISVEIAEMRNKQFSSDHCLGKWKGLKSMYKKIKIHNDTSGCAPKHWEYFNEMDELLSKTPQLSATPPSDDIKVFSLHEDLHSFDFHHMIEPESNYSSPPVSKKMKVMGDIERRERMHREHMAKMDKFLELFQTLVNHVTSQSAGPSSNF